MIVLGITGTIGAGKGTIVDYLVSKKGFEHFSVRAFLLEQIREAGLPENRDSMFNLANELRAKHGSSFVTDKLFERASINKKNSIIESIRTPGEIFSLREKGNFWLLAVDADPVVRYDRIVVRNSETDNISFETFEENEQREMNSTDSQKQNLSKCIIMADFLLINNGNRSALEEQVDRILDLIQVTSEK